VAIWIVSHVHLHPYPFFLITRKEQIKLKLSNWRKKDLMFTFSDPWWTHGQCFQTYLNSIIKIMLLINRTDELQLNLNLNNSNQAQNPIINSNPRLIMLWYSPLNTSVNSLLFVAYKFFVDFEDSIKQWN